MTGKAPQTQLEVMNPEKTRAIIHSLRQLYDMGKPETNLELKERIDMFFQFCEDSSVRPGVQALCTALHISRTTLFRWSNGEDCDRERQEIVSMAKSFIDSFLEQVTLSGQVSPPVGIFLLKNWCSYKDTVSIEENIPNTKTTHALTAAQLPKLGNMAEDNGSNATLPYLADTKLNTIVE